MCSVWARLIFFGRYLPHRVFPDSRLRRMRGCAGTIRKGYEKDCLYYRSFYHFSDKPHALPFGIAVMLFGLSVIAIAACNDR